MPTYDYQCQQCGKKLEVSQKITAEPLRECPACHAPALQRGPGGGSSLLFQGTGFYSTDYRSPPGPSSQSCDSSPSSSSGCCPCKK